MKKSTCVALLLASLLPGISFAATPRTFGDLANLIVRILGSATLDLIVLAIVIYFWGVTYSLFKPGKEGSANLRNQLLWGVFVIFLAVSVWGIITLLQSTIFGSNSGIGSSTGGATCTNLNCQFGQ